VAFVGWLYAKKIRERVPAIACTIYAAVLQWIVHGPYYAASLARLFRHALFVVVVWSRCLPGHGAAMGWHWRSH
jgi:hypothetical protein